jgi:small GTP-binding protein
METKVGAPTSRVASPSRIQPRLLPCTAPHSSPCPRTPFRIAPCRLSSLRFSAADGSGYASSSGNGRDTSPQRPTLLPAGKRQIRVQLPALFLEVTAADVEAQLADIRHAIAGGATAVVLCESPGGGAAQLYEAAIALKEALRGRAMLLLLDRTDIADAVGAEGTLLSASGLPTVVAKGMTQDKLALVGRIVADDAGAVQAAAEGANFVVLAKEDGESSGLALPSPSAVTAAKSGQRSGSSVPLLTVITEDSAMDGGARSIDDLVAAGIDGMVVRTNELVSVAARTAEEHVDSMSITDAAARLLDLMGRNGAIGNSADKEAQANESIEGPVVTQVSQLLSARREEMVAAEKDALGRLAEFLESACPFLEETALLRDALTALDELFLLVVVGEFNSGKSAVINALLGRRVLAEGILPTTNEISVVKWADPNHAVVDEAEQTADGLYVRRVPADLLKEVNVVDTPGTNVIIDRQQRLTEEFVPRADLVLFVLSADRPLTDSEVRFLKYIRQWGKKVVFVVNKVDLLTSEAEIAEVTRFVKDNASRLLGVESPTVLPVSARLASEAKLACRAAERDDGVGALTSAEQMCLSVEPSWKASRFEELESFVLDFLLGGPDGSATGESVRLKLTTPLSVAAALLDAAEKQLETDLEVARADAASIALVRQQLALFKADMVKEGRLQREEVSRQVGSLVSSAATVIDSTLTLSNWDALSAYILGPGSRGGRLPVADKFREQVPRDAAGAVGAVVREHSIWISSNCGRQADNYRAFAAARAASLGSSLDEVLDGSVGALPSDAEARKRWREARRSAATLDLENAPAAVVQPPGSSGASLEDSGALIAAQALDPSKTEALLEEEVRDAVLSATSTAAGAAGIGVVLTTVLPSTLEDLLALALAGAVGYASLLNLPLRRAEAKRKVEAAAAEVASQIATAMERELETSLEQCESSVLAFMQPLEVLANAEVQRAERVVAVRKELAEEVTALQRRAASVE